MKIVYLSTFPPRECGIATFNLSLISGIQANLKKEGQFEQEFIVALNDSEDLDEYEYPQNVKFIIRQENEKDYLKAAELINNSSIDVCILQHEFGIFGGQSGIYILPLLHRVEKPVVTVLHTILKEPTFIQKIIIQEIGKQSAKLVVFNIRALPKIIDKHPETIYAILGNTHPVVARKYGEEYRDSLKLLATELKVDKHLVFINRFLPEKELVNYLSAADIYITPYINEAQISSGTLSYAIGAGAACLSTPYWHAVELLNGSRGQFFDFRDANGLASLVNDLFDNPQKLAELRENAYEYGLDLRWPNITSKYLALLNDVIDKHVTE